MLYKLLLGFIGLVAIVPRAYTLPSIAAVGSKFFTSDGNQWFVKGIAYQLTPSDPLIDTEQCQLDANLMQDLGANAIRVYHVNSSADHSGCMSAFGTAGIYVFVDLDTFDTQIVANNPQWTNSQFRAFSAVLDEFQQYDNTAGFFVGNEVLSQPNDAPAAAYVLAAAHDMKAYRDSNSYRDIPVGYSAADIATLRPMLQDFLVCRDNVSERIDFFSLNAYEWCGETTYDQSGYSNLQSQAAGYPVPVFFSETGCNAVKPRTFTDQAAILGPDMEGTWSGAMIYEWIEEVNDYGIVSYGPTADGAATASNVQDGFLRSGTPIPVLPDFDNLKSQWATLNPTAAWQSAYATSSITPPSCPSATIGWDVDPSIALPTLISSSWSAMITSTAEKSRFSSSTPHTSPTTRSSSLSDGSKTRTTYSPAPDRTLSSETSLVTATMSSADPPRSMSSTPISSTVTSMAGSRFTISWHFLTTITTGHWLFIIFLGVVSSFTNF